VKCESTVHCRRSIHNLTGWKVPHQLFTDPHPHRVCNCWKVAPIDHTIVIHLPVNSILFASIKLEEVLTYKLEYVDGNGEICIMRINIENPKSNETIMVSSRVTIPEFSTFAHPLQPSNFCAFRTTLAVVDGSHSTVP
jgi:hypothetical protein